MIITDLSIRKLDKSDPRYPDPPKRADGSHVPYSDIYHCECKTDGGQEFETSFLATDDIGDMTPRRIGDMLRCFADAVSKMEQQKAA